MAANKVMKKVFILICISFSYITTQAQQSGSYKAFYSISIGVSFSPDYSYRILGESNDGNSRNLEKAKRNNSEIAKLGYTAGFDLSIPLSTHLAFETGVQFANKDYQTKQMDLIYETPDITSPTKASDAYTYQYIGLPLKLKYIAGKGKIKFHTGVGLVSSLLLKAKQDLVLEYSNGKRDREPQGQISRTKKVDLSAVINLGVVYQMNNTISLLAEPTFRCGVLELRDNALSEHLWSAGLNIGFRYAMK